MVIDLKEIFRAPIEHFPKRITLQDNIKNVLGYKMYFKAKN
jgi:hypothetical protein